MIIAVNQRDTDITLVALEMPLLTITVVFKYQSHNPFFIAELASQ